MVVSELLVLTIPIMLAIAIGLISQSGMLGGGVGILSLAYIAINSQNSIITGSFMLVIVFMGLATAVYMASMIMGDSNTQT